MGPYPVIHSSPPPGLIIRNIRSVDYLFALLLGSGTYLIGHFHKQPRVLRKPNRIIFGLTGLAGGLVFGFQTASTRLMGYAKNDVEVARYPYRLDTLTAQKYQTVAN